MLADALGALTPETDPDLLVGIETSDDAAVYRISDDAALITTVDFITPPVDDPYWFGQIAAANSLSDVYAMGGRVLTALNLVMYPVKKLGMEHLKEILRGAHDKIHEAGGVAAGGHSIEDPEPKFGLAVTGIVHPQRILTNCGARPGDVLVLTKPVGSGVLFNAVVLGRLPYGEIEPMLPEVAALNRAAMEVALDYDISACTDISGFGIAGHTLEMALGAGLGIRLDPGAIPVYPHALEMYGRGVTTGSNKENHKILAGRMQVKCALSAEMQELLVDPQTSGGLLMAVRADQAGALVGRLAQAGVKHATVVGEVSDLLPQGITIA